MWAHFWDTLRKAERVQTHTLLTDHHGCRVQRGREVWDMRAAPRPVGRACRGGVPSVQRVMCSTSRCCKRVWGITGAELIFYLFYTLPLMRCRFLGPFILFISSFFTWFHFFYCRDSFYLLSFFLLPRVFYSLTSFYCSVLRLQSLLFFLDQTLSSFLTWQAFYSRALITRYQLCVLLKI